MWKPVLDFDDYFNGESVNGTDLMVWIQSGTYHVPHAEDAPVTPTTSGNNAGFVLQVRAAGRRLRVGQGGVRCRVGLRSWPCRSCAALKSSSLDSSRPPHALPPLLRNGQHQLPTKALQLLR